MTREQAINYLISSGFSEEQVSEIVRALTYESTTKNDLGVHCIDRAELLKAMDTWDKFGNDPNEGPIPLRTPALQDRYVPYVKYDDMVNCVKGMPSVIPYMPSATPQEPKIVPIAEIKFDEDKLKELVNKAQEPIFDKINKMKSEIADSLEFWDYSPNNNPLARDMLETLTNFLGDLRGEGE